MRNQTIDIAKGIGILTVVICHNWILYHDRGEFSRVIFSFHMPLFFFISGIFFKPNLSFIDTVKSKAGALLKPYAVVALALIIYDFLYSLFKGNQFDILQALIAKLYSSTFTLDWVQMWFLTHLFSIYIFSWILYWGLIKHITNIVTRIIAILVIFFIGTQTLTLFWRRDFNPFGINTLLYDQNPQLLGLPFNVDILLVTAPIFLAGFYFSKQILSFKFNPILFWSSLTIFTFLHYRFNYTMGLHAREYDQFIITSCQMITGIYLVFGLSALSTKFELTGKILAKIGSASLFILIFHFSFQHIFTGVFQYYFPQHAFLVAFIAFIASVLYSLTIYEIVNKSAFLKSLFYSSTKK